MSAFTHEGERTTVRWRSVAHKEKQPERMRIQAVCSRTYVLVRLAGFEPTTPWFVAKYSIQLSYSR